MINSFRYGVITNKSLYFDGVDEYVDFGNDATFDFSNTDSFSYGGWFRFDDISVQQVFLGKDAFGAGGLNRGYFMAIFPALDPNAISFQIRSAGGNRIRGYTTTTTLASSTWYHIYFTYDGSKDISGCNVYINGSAESITSRNNNLTNTVNNTMAFRVAKVGNSTDYFGGYCDQISVYSAELTSGQVSTLYNSGCPTTPSATNLVSSYIIDSNDDATATINDHTGSNDGTATNMESGDLSDTTVC